MADRLTVARPYAKAAFRQAQAAGRLGTWSEALGRAALAVVDPRVRSLFGSPKVTATQLAELMRRCRRRAASTRTAQLPRAARREQAPAVPA